MLLASAAPSAAQRSDGECVAGAKPMTRLELMFGMSRKGGRTISDQEWRVFLDEEVTPRFPDGLTILQGYGQWRGNGGKVMREPMRLLLIMFEPASDSEARIEAIRTAFKHRFHQDSVLRVNSAACASF